MKVNLCAAMLMAANPITARRSRSRAVMDLGRNYHAEKRLEVVAFCERVLLVRFSIVV
jgi:hypothetical protein